MAKQLYAAGAKIPDTRISIQLNDRMKAMELNKKAIEKFSESYEADTLYADAALFALECTMYGQEYKKCIYWTTKHTRLDTTKSNTEFCRERIEFCKKQLSQ